MTTTTANHDHPEYITKAAMEAYEGRIINRLAELELRIERRFNEQQRWMVGLILPLYALVLGVILTVALGTLNILGKL